MRERTIVVMLDEILITETPPLAYGYGRISQQVRIPYALSPQQRLQKAGVLSGNFWLAR